MLQEQLVQEMRATTDIFKKGVLKVLVAEFQRGQTKDITDDEVTKIINKCIKNEKILASHARTADDAVKSTRTIDILLGYIKHNEQVTNDEVAEWIVANIDFSKLPNKMAAMKSIMAQFKGQIDGNAVKEILQNI